MTLDVSNTRTKKNMMGLLSPSVRLPVCLLASCGFKEVEMVCRETVGSVINPTWVQQERKEISL